MTTVGIIPIINLTSFLVILFSKSSLLILLFACLWLFQFETQPILSYASACKKRLEAIAKVVRLLV